MRSEGFPPWYMTSDFLYASEDDFKDGATVCLMLYFKLRYMHSFRAIKLWGSLDAVPGPPPLNRKPIYQ